MVVAPLLATLTERRRGPFRAANLMFVKEFLRNPLRTASLVPSSQALARRMVAPLAELGDQPVVVELGPGSGAFTTALQNALPAGGRHIAVELNPRLAAQLRLDFPEVQVVDGAAGDLPKILAEAGVEKADLVVSGLPWQAFAGPVGRQLIATIADCTADGGCYAQFTYSWTRWAPPAKRQLASLRESFGSVQISRTVWRNFPPAFVYTATRPVRSAKDK